MASPYFCEYEILINNIAQFLCYGNNGLQAFGTYRQP